MTQSQNSRIKEHIRRKIDTGVWETGDRIPSESMISREFGVSRMTVNRALKELEVERRITRVQGVGSFVAKVMPQAPLFEIQSIRTEIESRGEVHTCRVLALEARAADDRNARRMQVPAGSEIYYLQALHLSGGRPLQLEHRYVRPRMAPEFLDQDFTRETASDYLMRVVHFAELEHTVSAIPAGGEVGALLDIDPAAPCLQLNRKTMVGDTVITDVDLIHPGTSFSLLGRLSNIRASERIAS